VVEPSRVAELSGPFLAAAAFYESLRDDLAGRAVRDHGQLDGLVAEITARARVELSGPDRFALLLALLLHAVAGIGDSAVVDIPPDLLAERIAARP
jgi:hypothetical protein